MKMIAGLGNPGNEYAKTKHNAGFLFVDALAGHLGASGWKQKENALVAEARIGEGAAGQASDLYERER